MSHALINEKESLRRVIQRCLAELPEEEKKAESEFVCRQLLKNIPEGSTVCGYYPLPTELDLRPLLRALLHRHDQVFLPSVEAHQIVFRRLEDEENLTAGTLGNLEPHPDSPVLVHDANIVLVPGRVFDSRGYRLGRGKGIYDQWMRSHRARHTGTRYWGVAFNCQLVEKVPTEAHDQAVDRVITAQHSEYGNHR